MNFLTRKEQRSMTAVGYYPRRKLNPIEQLIKESSVIVALPANNQVEKKIKEIRVEEAVEQLTALTTSESLPARFRLAMWRKDMYDALVEEYPYVEFEKVINEGVSGLSPLARATYNGLGTPSISQSMIWLRCFLQVVDELPQQFGETYIGTPATMYQMLRRLASSGHKPAYGLILPPSLQEQVDSLFCNSRFYNSLMRTIDMYQLHRIPDIYARLKMERPALLDKYEIEFRVIEAPSKGLYVLGNASTTITVYKRPQADNEERVALFHFQY